MSTYNVTTWSELVSYLSQGRADDVDTVINLMNDIDMNDVAPLGVSTTQIKCFGRSMVLKGNGHCIKNLRTSISNPQPIFSMADYHYLPTKALNIQNLDFVNLICAGSDFLYDSSDYRQVNFTNCRFVGCRTGNAYLINQRAKITCTSCYFDMPWYGYDSTAYSYTSLIPSLTSSQVSGAVLPQANYCWFHETYGGWRITASSTGSWNDSNMVTTSCRAFCMNGCYVDGTMTVTGGFSANVSRSYCYCYVSNSALIYTNAWTSVYTSNVIEIKWKVSSSIVRSYSMAPYTHKLACVLRKWLYRDSTLIDDTITWTLISESGITMPTPIQATSAQMKDASWLQSQGFPIVPTT